MRLGEKTHAQDRFGMSALHLAACNGQLASAQELVRVGVPLALSNSTGDTPFHCAASLGHT